MFRQVDGRRMIGAGPYKMVGWDSVSHGLEPGIDVQRIGSLTWPSWGVTKAWSRMVVMKMGRKEK